MEPTGAEKILEQLALGFGSLQGHAEATDRRLDALQQRVDDVQALVITVKEAAELQSVRLDEVDRRLTARTDSLERRMERGFARVDERFEALTAEMRSGFAEMRRGFDELRRTDRGRGPKRDD
jgi:type II secretory pathway predicted ATPase ExeA